MTRDYKPNTHTSSSGGRPFTSGLLVGLLAGIALSLGVVFYLQKGESPFSAKPATQNAPPASPQPPAAPGKGPAPSATPATAPGTTPEENNELTFWEILGNGDNPTVVAPTPPVQPARGKFLQAGVYPTEQEADNAKAQLAFLGFDVVIQPLETPGKPRKHLVQVGPLNDADIPKTRAKLRSNGFEAVQINRP